MQSKWTIAVVIGLLGLVAAAGTGSATMGSGFTQVQGWKGVFDEIHVKTKTDGHQVELKTKGVSDAHVVNNAIAPGGHTGWHTHPGPSLIIVTAGEVTAYDGDDHDCTPTRYAPGQGFVDPGNGHVHLLRNETDTPAETVAVQIVPTGATRRIDAPAPGHCPF